MRLRALPRGLADTRGSTIIEFALSALLLLLLIFGVFEMSRMLLIYNTVANAARAGDRYAIVNGEDTGTTVSQIKTLVKNYLSAAPMNTSNATVNVCYAGATVTGGVCSGGSNAKGSTVSVSVTYPYDPFVTFYSSFLSIHISSTSQGVITW